MWKRNQNLRNKLTIVLCNQIRNYPRYIIYWYKSNIDIVPCKVSSDYILSNLKSNQKSAQSASASAARPDDLLFGSYIINHSDTRLQRNVCECAAVWGTDIMACPIWWPYNLMSVGWYNTIYNIYNTRFWFHNLSKGRNDLKMVSHIWNVEVVTRIEMYMRDFNLPFLFAYFRFRQSDFRQIIKIYY